MNKKFSDKKFKSNPSDNSHDTYDPDDICETDLDSSLIIKNALFFKHPVLVQGFALAPVLIASTTIKNALAIAFCLLFVSVPSVLFSSIPYIKDKLPKWIRVFAYVLIASVFYIPAYFIVENFYPEAYFNLGVFMPLIVVSSFVYNRSEKFAHNAKINKSFLDIIFNNIAFTLCIVLVSAIREFLGNGTLLGFEIIKDKPIPGILFSFSGFIICGFLAAILQYMKNKALLKQQKNNNSQRRFADE